MSTANQYLVALHAFQAHLGTVLDKAMEFLDDPTGKAEPAKFDIKIEVNGQSIVIPFQADSYTGLESLIRDEIQYEERYNHG